MTTRRSRQREEEELEAAIAESLKDTKGSGKVNGSGSRASGDSLSGGVSGEECLSYSETQKDADLRLNLNLPIGEPLIKALQMLFYPISLLFTYSGLEFLLCGVMWTSLVPDVCKHYICNCAWKLYSQVHRITLGNRTGLHESLSYEAHALTTMMWPFRLFPMTLKRMRFGLCNIGFNFPYDGSLRTRQLEGIHGEYLGKMVLVNDVDDDADAASKKVIFWIYGGAFLSGDVDGNVPLANHYGKAAGKNVFVVNYQLCPEGAIMDAFADVLNAYEWLLASDFVDTAEDITVFGISSGGGLALKLMQHIHASEDFDEQVSAGVLICPWVNYNIDNLPRSLKENTKHDLVVHGGVYDYVLPLASAMAMVDGAPQYKTVSPIFGSMRGLPNLLVISSNHEVTTDETYELVGKCKEAGVNVVHHSQNYLSHVFALLPFLPEAKIAMAVIESFLKRS